MTNLKAAPLTVETIKLGLHYLVVTDGSGPPATAQGGKAVGTGGHASILQLKQGDLVLRQKPFASQVVAIATNSRMEMMAPLAAFDALQDKDIPVLLECDSKFLVDGMNGGCVRWSANGWKTSKGDAVANQDLWQAIIAVCLGQTTIWTWVKAHSGHVLNELADNLASSAKAGKNVGKNGRVIAFPKGLSF